MKRTALKGVLSNLAENKGAAKISTFVDKLNQDWKVEAFKDNREVPIQKLLVIAVWSAQLVTTTFGAYVTREVGVHYVRIFFKVIKYLVWIALFRSTPLPRSL
jgi:hypothetical protein